MSAVKLRIEICVEHGHGLMVMMENAFIVSRRCTPFFDDAEMPNPHDGGPVSPWSCWS